MMNHIAAISEHSEFIGGGEYSFVDLVTRLAPAYQPVAFLPDTGEVQKQLQSKNVVTEVVPLPQMRPWRFHAVLRTLVRGIVLCQRHRIRIIYANGMRACL